ncbi:tetratricopeptide repeat protein [Lysobacter korlensis]|uniref:Tetratricopeptide repeat protein n=1 Tax=Lysobacter korlensis TaxID=553636 RepID=A0ABV6RRM0_9GAMM
MSDAAEIQPTAEQLRAEALHQQGDEADEAGDEERALSLYMQALELDFTRAMTHYNVGLIYKYRGDWEKSRRFNKRAAELAPDHEAALWNLAIAATALRDWTTARAAWKQVGIDVGEGDGPIEGDFGINPVRLNPHEDAEVVWAQRICPVRARIISVPFPESGFAYGDIVLHDGAGTGTRMHNGVEKSVFNVLEPFESSPYSTFQVDVQISCEQDLRELLAACERAGVECEDWTYSVRMICKGCSEGSAHDEHEVVEDPEWKDRRRLGLAAFEEGPVRYLLEQWQTADRRVETFECALEAGFDG